MERDPRDRCLTPGVPSIDFKSSHRLTVSQEVHDLLKAERERASPLELENLPVVGSRRLLHRFLAVAIKRFIAFQILLGLTCRGS